MQIAILSVILIIILFLFSMWSDKLRARNALNKEWQEDIAYKMENAKPNEFFWCIPGNNPGNPIQEEGIWIGCYNTFFPEHLFKTVRQKGMTKYKGYIISYNAIENYIYINDLPVTDKMIAYLKKHTYLDIYDKNIKI